MPEFCLTAEDGCVPIDVLEFMAAAVDLQMRRDVKPIHDTNEIWTVGALPSLDGLQDMPGVRKILTFKRKLGVVGALGFHIEKMGIEYAEALVPHFDDERIDGTTASHEIIETFGDPTCDLSWPMPSGAQADYELADPVESDRYDIEVTLGRETRTVAVSNFVTPAWFQIPGTEFDRRYDFLSRLSAPFTMTAGGYYRLVDIDGTESYVYADQAARERVAEKLANVTSRVSRRGRPAT